MQFGQVYCENGPLHGQTLMLNELQKMQLRGGFYMLDEGHASPQKVSWLTWVSAEHKAVTVHIADDSHETSVDTARIDRSGMTWLRLRKVGMDQDLYMKWKKQADSRTPVALVFQGEKYEGHTDLVGMNQVEGYMFLEFKGKQVAKAAATEQVAE